MTIYWIALICSLIFSFIVMVIKKKNNTELAFKDVFISLIPLFLIALFRWNIGTDVVYKTGFYYQEYSLIRIGYGNVFNYEIGFYYLMKIFCLLNIKIYYFYSFVTIISFILLSKFIKDNCKYLPLAILIYFFADLYLFSFSTLRQSLAIMISLYSLSKMINNNQFYKDIKWWIYSIVAILFHNSIIYLLVMVLISKIRFNKKRLVLLMLIGFLIFPIVQYVLPKVLIYSNYFQKYTNTLYYTFDFTPSYFIIALFIFILAYINYDKLVESNKTNMYLINMTGLITIIMLNSQILLMPYRIFPLFIPVYLLFYDRLMAIISVKNIFNKFLIILVIISPFIFYFFNNYYRDKSNYKKFTYSSIFEYSNQINE